MASVLAQLTKAAKKNFENAKGTTRVTQGNVTAKNPQTTVKQKGSACLSTLRQTECIGQCVAATGKLMPAYLLLLQKEQTLHATNHVPAQLPLLQM